MRNHKAIIKGKKTSGIKVRTAHFLWCASDGRIALSKRMRKACLAKGWNV